MQMAGPKSAQDVKLARQRCARNQRFIAYMRNMEFQRNTRFTTSVQGGAGEADGTDERKDGEQKLQDDIIKLMEELEEESKRDPDTKRNPILPPMDYLNLKPGTVDVAAYDEGTVDQMRADMDLYAEQQAVDKLLLDDDPRKIIIEPSINKSLAEDETTKGMLMDHWAATLYDKCGVTEVIVLDQLPDKEEMRLLVTFKSKPG